MATPPAPREQRRQPLSQTPSTKIEGSMTRVVHFFTFDTLERFRDDVSGSIAYPGVHYNGIGWHGSGGWLHANTPSIRSSVYQWNTPSKSKWSDILIMILHTQMEDKPHRKPCKHHNVGYFCIFSIHFYRMSDCSCCRSCPNEMCRLSHFGLDHASPEVFMTPRVSSQHFGGKCMTTNHTIL
jgi:hypothetical protein